MLLNILIFINAIAVGILIYFLLKSVAILTGILGIIMGDLRVSISTKPRWNYRRNTGFSRVNFGRSFEEEMILKI